MTARVLVRSPDLFEGYWQQRDATREVKRADGWLHTGDVGEWRDGTLRLVDRARDFLVTAGGKTISPSFIENTLRASPYVGGSDRVRPRPQISHAPSSRSISTPSPTGRAPTTSPIPASPAWSAHRRSKGLIEPRSTSANGELARVEQIKAFRILPKALDPEEDGEPVTPTRKVKRKLMYERFKRLVEDMYDDSEERLIAAGAGDVKL